jgi:hypothetical protein
VRDFLEKSAKLLGFRECGSDSDYLTLLAARVFILPWWLFLRFQSTSDPQVVKVSQGEVDAAVLLMINVNLSW